MNEFVKIQQTNDSAQRVSAREMYLNIGLKSENYSRWVAKHIAGNPFASEGVDWTILIIPMSEHQQRGRFAADYLLTLDFAKKLCMQARTEKGERVRNYFLQVERAALENLAATRQLGSAHTATLEIRVRQLEAKATTTEVQDFTVYGYSRLCGKPVCGNEAQIIGRKAARRCKKLGRSIGRVQDPRFGMVNTYPVEILNAVFADFYSHPRF